MADQYNLVSEPAAGPSAGGGRWAPARSARRAGPPRDAVIAVTGHCNAHCVMCDIWKHRQADELRPEHMRRLPPELASVNLSGGEPFLRGDLPQFVQEARSRCARAVITISTNGYLSQRIADTMERIVDIDPGVRLAVSLDGLGSVHDRVRGDGGAFDSVIRLLDLLQGRGCRGVRLSMTLSQVNADQVLGVAELARSRGLELGIVAAHRCRTHMRLENGVAGQPTEAPRRSFQTLVARWLRSWNPRQWLRAHFAANTYRYLARIPQALVCRAGRDFFFLQADGTVYACGVNGRVMGNLVEQEWEEVWNSPAAGSARSAAERCGGNCWIVCTVRSWYRRHAWSVAAWVAGQKLLSHLRLLRLPAPPAEEADDTRSAGAEAPASPASAVNLPIEAPRADPSH